MSRITSQHTDQYVETIELTEAERLRLLADERRHLVIDILAGRTNPVELRELSREIAKRDDRLDAGDERTLEQVRTTLHHVHLPLMDELDVLHYDVETHWVRLLGNDAEQ